MLPMSRETIQEEGGMLPEKTTALIVAGGQGTRLGGAIKKQFLSVLGKPLLAHTIEKFQNCPAIDAIILVVPEDELALSERLRRGWHAGKVERIVAGGAERHHSVQSGLTALSADCRWVAIHDGVRPMVTCDQIAETLRVARETGAAILAVPAKDTIKEIGNGLVTATLDRQRLVQVQTPQVFRKEIILEAYRQAFASGNFSTDDAALVEMIGVPVRIVSGDYRNIKVTSADDLLTLEALLRAEGRA
jgi:2-C-methyl-D-erythritol 4-phosphate cytidylyltransferase